MTIRIHFKKKQYEWSWFRASDGDLGRVRAAFNCEILLDEKKIDLRTQNCGRALPSEYKERECIWSVEKWWNTVHILKGRLVYFHWNKSWVRYLHLCVCAHECMHGCWECALTLFGMCLCVVWVGCGLVFGRQFEERNFSSQLGQCNSHAGLGGITKVPLGNGEKGELC